MSNETRREEGLVTYLYTCDFAGRRCIIHGRRREVPSVQLEKMGRSFRSPPRVHETCFSSCIRVKHKRVRDPVEEKFETKCIVLLTVLP